MRHRKYLIFLIAFFLNILLTSGQKQSYFTIAINSNVNTTDFQKLVDLARTKDKRYKKVHVYRYTTTLDSEGLFPGLMSDKPLRLKKLKVPTNEELFINKDSCSLFPKSNLQKLINRTYQTIVNSKTSQIKNNTEIIIYDPTSSSILEIQGASVYKNFYTLERYLNHLMNNRKRIYLIYNQLKDFDLTMKIIFPEDKPEDVLLMSCITTEISKIGYYYHYFKFNLPYICSEFSPIIQINFYVDDSINISNKKLVEPYSYNSNQDNLTQKYYWKMNNGNYCFFIKCIDFYNEICASIENCPSIEYLEGKPLYYNIEVSYLKNILKSDTIEFKSIPCDFNNPIFNVPCDCEK